MDLRKDLINSPVIVEKCKDLVYAQHLYAALCNVTWKSMDLSDLISQDTWSCTWREAAKIVAEIRNAGEDYTEFYCSGWLDNWSKNLPVPYKNSQSALSGTTSHTLVREAVVTNEIAKDLKQLGWEVCKELHTN